MRARAVSRRRLRRALRPGRLRLCAVCAVCAAAAGCGGTHRAHTSASTQPATAPARHAAATASPCSPAARAALARFVHIDTTRVAETRATGGNAMPQCTFTVPAGSGHPRIRVTANLDSGAQPYFRLERAAVEESQRFATQRQVAAPENVPHLGMDADWFPAEHRLLTTDGRVLVTITVAWHGESQAHRRALARAIAPVYLGRPVHVP